MSDQDKVIQSLREAVTLAPDNVPLRKLLADMLFQEDIFEEAEKEYRAVLSLTPADEGVKLRLAKSFFNQQKWMMALVVLEELIRGDHPPAQVFELAGRAYEEINQPERAVAAYHQAGDPESMRAAADLEKKPCQETQTPPPAARKVFPKAEIPPEKTLPGDHEADRGDEEDDRVRLLANEWMSSPQTELERSPITFEDVGGMEKLKDQIRIKIIHPLSKPELYKAYGKTIGGSILMYGPPGCGKTYLARATAGEVDAYFISVGIHDVLNMYLGQSESNLHALFDLARRNRPCVLFIDEVDALGASRSDMRQSAGRHLINQLLSELDGIETSNEGVLVLAASNAPWYIDTALRRPGRFDQLIFVPPPDQPARVAILQIMLKDKPVETLDFEQIARKTDGFSGADLKGVVDSAIEEKLNEAIKRSAPVPLTTRDLLRAAGEIKPSTKDWFATARNYALYSNQSGTYDDVLAYLKLDRDSGLFSKFRRDE